jgi:hypothetical protein
MACLVTLQKTYGLLKMDSHYPLAAAYELVTSYLDVTWVGIKYLYRLLLVRAVASQITN